MSDNYCTLEFSDTDCKVVCKSASPKNNITDDSCIEQVSCVFSSFYDQTGPAKSVCESNSDPICNLCPCNQPCDSCDFCATSFCGNQSFPSCNTYESLITCPSIQSCVPSIHQNEFLVCRTNTCNSGLDISPRFDRVKSCIDENKEYNSIGRFKLSSAKITDDSTDKKNTMNTEQDKQGSANAGTTSPYNSTSSEMKKQAATVESHSSNAGKKNHGTSQTRSSESSETTITGSNSKVGRKTDSILSSKTSVKSSNRTIAKVTSGTKNISNKDDAIKQEKSMTDVKQDPEKTELVVHDFEKKTYKEGDVYIPASDCDIITPTPSNINLTKKTSDPNDTEASENAGGETRTSATTRRQSVAASKYDPSKDGAAKKIVHPKTTTQAAHIEATIKPILLFRELDKEQLQDVVNAMFERKVKKGDVVIKQGEAGDNFYVIYEGSFDIIVDGKKMAEMKEGFFGELALMYNQPRGATVKATSNAILWAMDRTAFRQIVLQSAYNKRKLYDNLLESVPMLKSINKYERMNIADALVTKYYKNGKRVIKEGDKADCMFFVVDGNVVCTIFADDSKERVLTTIEKGGYFGELALITHKPRAASAFALGDIKLAKLDISAFERLLGPCMEIMQRSIDTYNRRSVKVMAGGMSD